MKLCALRLQRGMQFLPRGSRVGWDGAVVVDLCASLLIDLADETLVRRQAWPFVHVCRSLVSVFVAERTSKRGDEPLSKCSAAEPRRCRRNSLTTAAEVDVNFGASVQRSTSRFVPHFAREKKHTPY